MHGSGPNGSGSSSDLNNALLESRTPYLDHNAAAVDDHRPRRRIILDPSGSPNYSSSLPGTFLSAVRQAHNPRLQQPDLHPAPASRQPISDVSDQNDDEDDDDDEDRLGSSSSRSNGLPERRLEYSRLLDSIPRNSDGTTEVVDYAHVHRYTLGPPSDGQQGLIGLATMSDMEDYNRREEWSESDHSDDPSGSDRHDDDEVEGWVGPDRGLNEGRTTDTDEDEDEGALDAMAGSPGELVGERMGPIPMGSRATHFLHRMRMGNMSRTELHFHHAVQHLVRTGHLPQDDLIVRMLLHDLRPHSLGARLREVQRRIQTLPRDPCIRMNYKPSYTHAKHTIQPPFADTIPRAPIAVDLEDEDDDGNVVVVDDDDQRKPFDPRRALEKEDRDALQFAARPMSNVPICASCNCALRTAAEQPEFWLYFLPCGHVIDGLCRDKLGAPNPQLGKRKRDVEEEEADMPTNATAKLQRGVSDQVATPTSNKAQDSIACPVNGCNDYWLYAPGQPSSATRLFA